MSVMIVQLITCNRKARVENTITNLLRQKLLIGMPINDSLVQRRSLKTR